MKYLETRKGCNSVHLVRARDLKMSLPVLLMMMTSLPVVLLMMSLPEQLMETVVQVLVKDHAETIVAECPQLITNNDVESECV